MKRITTTFALLLLLTGYAGAQQQVNNAGFESWDTIGDYTQPKNWFTLNSLATFGYDPSTTITSDAHSGSFAVQLESIAAPGAGADLAGVLCTGPILTPTFTPDFTKMKVPFNSKPLSLQVYYKSFPQAGDTCLLGMCLTRWNLALQKTDTIAEAGLKFDHTVGEYALASCPFVYNSPLQPDSMFIIVSSSCDGFNPVIGSKLILDDLHLTYSTGLSDVTGLSLQLYPNPANAQLTIQTAETGLLRLYSITGVLVHQQSVNAKQTSVDVSTLADGMYFMTMHTEQGMITSRKIKIQH